MQSLPDSRAQTYEELYGPPENFLEIEVRTSQTHPSHRHSWSPLIPHTSLSRRHILPSPPEKGSNVIPPRNRSATPKPTAPAAACTRPTRSA